MPLPASLPELLAAHADAVAEDVHTVLPARVLAYDPAKQTVDVEFCVRVAHVAADDEPVYETLPNLSAVPVAFMRGAGFQFSFPLAAGDAVWVHTTEAAIGQWRATGAVPSDAEQTRRHPLGSAFAVPGAFAIGAALAGASGALLVIGRDTGDARIEVSATNVAIGAGATDAAAKAGPISSYTSALEALLTTIAGATVPSTAPAVGVFTTNHGNPFRLAVGTTVARVK